MKTTTTTTRQVKSEQISALLSDGVATVLASQDFQAALDTLAKFHDYSLNNVMLILAQRPTATLVAGFKKWLTLNRCVRKGEKGIAIMVPHVRKATTEDEDDRITFGTGYVFDVSQTDGEDLPRLPVSWLTGDLDAALIARTAAVATGLGFDVALDAPNPGGRAKAVYIATGKRIEVYAGAAGLLTGSALLHELAHGLTAETFTDRDQREAVAEGTAYTVLQHLGIDTGTQAFGYIASWCTDADRFRAVMGEIRRISHTIIDALDARDQETDAGAAGENLPLAA